ncbi:hypothetical protein GCM10010912_56070 [Paenibacillus albidus]|uniref:Uncharacterized protein n=1 Tax=Paenibacillus albidus TaxID=2041023 RepID=A0A917D036_9BACL|nr:hypothetical protein GCM10010912_56070 [Paenibacillus albidus]
MLTDSLMPQAVRKGISEHKLPTFQYLIEHGQYFENMVSSFPTMSVTINSSLLTGKYPDAHHVPGLAWYSAKGRRLVNRLLTKKETVLRGNEELRTDGVFLCFENRKIGQSTKQRPNSRNPIQGED